MSIPELQEAELFELQCDELLEGYVSLSANRAVVVVVVVAVVVIHGFGCLSGTASDGKKNHTKSYNRIVMDQDGLLQ